MLLRTGFVILTNASCAGLNLCSASFHIWLQNHESVSTRHLKNSRAFTCKKFVHSWTSNANTVTKHQSFRKSQQWNRWSLNGLRHSGHKARKSHGFQVNSYSVNYRERNTRSPSSGMHGPTPKNYWNPLNLSLNHLNHR